MFKLLLTLFFVPFIVLGQSIQSFDTQLDTLYLEEFRSAGSTDSTSNIVQTLDTENQIEGAGCMSVEYSVHNSEGWGGFVKVEHVMKEVGAFDWSAYDSVSFWYNNVTPQDAAGTVHLRFNLYDNSDVDTSITAGDEMEFYYSFHYILDNEPGWNEIKVPLVADGNAWNGEAFNLTGWNGPAGNSFLDKDHIKGWSFEFSIGGSGEGNVTKGKILIDDLRLKGSLNALAEAPGFESGPQNEDGIPVGWGGWQSAWDGWGSLSHIATPMDPDTAYEGDYYAELGVDAGNGYAVIYQSAAAQPGQEWKLSSFIRDVTPGGAGGNFAALKIEAKSGETLLTASEVTQEGVTTDWKHFSTTMIMPEGTDVITAVLVATKWENDGIPAVYGFDNVTLVNMGTADTLAPAAPTGLIANTQNPYYNLIGWQQVPGETGETYSVYASQNPITDLNAVGVEKIASAIPETEDMTVSHAIIYPRKDHEVTYYYAVTCTDASANTSLPTTISEITNTAKGVPTISLDVPDNFVADGDLSEWETTNAMPFEMTKSTAHVGYGTFDDDNDLYAVGYIGVDDEFLYISFDVLDDVYSFDPGGNFYEDDIMVIFIGLYNQTKKHSAFQRGAEPDYRFNFESTHIQNDKAGEKLYTTDDANYFFEGFDPDYATEVKIPLDSILIDDDVRFHPQNGMKIAIDIEFHDSDATNVRDGILSYSPYNFDNSHQGPQNWYHTWIGDTNQIATDIKEDRNLVAHSYHLGQNYPNPFNPETTIEFSLAKTSDVKISVFNVIGQELEVLVNSKIQAGTYKTVFNGAKYASGIYFYKIQAGNFSDVRKMLIVK